MDDSDRTVTPRGIAPQGETRASTRAELEMACRGVVQLIDDVDRLNRIDTSTERPNQLVEVVGWIVCREWDDPPQELKEYEDVIASNDGEAATYIIAYLAASVGRIKRHIVASRVRRARRYLKRLAWASIKANSRLKMLREMKFHDEGDEAWMRAKVARGLIAYFKSEQPTLRELAADLTVEADLAEGCDPRSPLDPITDRSWIGREVRSQQQAKLLALLWPDKSASFKDVSVAVSGDELMGGDAIAALKNRTNQTLAEVAELIGVQARIKQQNGSLICYLTKNRTL